MNNNHNAATQKSVKPKRGRSSHVELVRRALRDLRDKAGITQAAMARTAGVSQSCVSDYLTGTMTPSNATIEALVDAANTLATAACDIALRAAGGKSVTA